LPAADILIAACARRHNPEFETENTDFERLVAI
jgi:predicted nucleic acid-binding protein